MAQTIVTTCSPGVYTNIGTGPLIADVISGNACYVIALSTQPDSAAIGQVVTANAYNVTDTTSVWAMPLPGVGEVVIQTVALTAGLSNTTNVVASSSSPASMQMAAFGLATVANPNYSDATYQPLSLTADGALRVDVGGTSIGGGGGGGNGGAVTQSGTWTTGRTWDLNSTTDSVTTVPSGTQTVSGAVTANIGTTNGLALDSTAQQILAAVKSGIGVSGTIWYDPTISPPVYYVRRETVNQGTGAWTVTWENINGSAATPIVTDLVAVADAQDIFNQTATYQAIGAGTGYAVNDILVHCFGVDTMLSQPTLAYSFWFNAGPSVPSGKILSTAPAANTYELVQTPVTIASIPLAPNAAQETGGNLAAINAKTPALGQATAAGSVPVVLPAAQLAALTPPTTVSLSAGSAAIGGVTQSGAWAVSVTNANAANLPTLGYAFVASNSPSYAANTVQSLSLTTTGALRVDGSKVTQPVSIATLPALPTGSNNIGSVTVSNFPVNPTAGQGLPNSLSNAWPTKLTDGTTVASVSALANSNAINVAIVDASGNQITSLGGGGGGVSGGGSINVGIPTTGTYTGWDDAGILVGTSMDTALPIQPGTGAVFASSQSGTWTVDINSFPSLPAGNNAIGSVVVSSLPSLPAGSNAIGSVTVSSIPALPAGANTIGNVGQSGTWAVTANNATPANFQTLSSGTVTTSAPTYVSGNNSPLSLTTNGALRTDSSAVTQPVSLSALPALTAGNAAIGTVGVTSLPSIPAGTNAIGSITNTSFTVTQATASNLNATVVGTGTFLVQNTAPIPTGTNSIGQVTANAGTNLNTSALALETGGNLASINVKTPALGQALASGSVPVVLTASQLTALTPLTSIALNAGANTIGNVGQSGSWTVSASNATAGNFLTLGYGTVSTAAPTYTSGNNNALSLTTSGALRVDASATTQPVSLVSLPSLPVGSNLIGSVNINSLPSLPAGSAAIGSVIVSTLPSLPTGANTIGAVTQAGSWSFTATQSIAGNLATLGYGSVSVSAPTYTGGNNNPLSLTTSGALRVDGSAVTQPVSGTISTIQSGSWNVGRTWNLTSSTDAVTIVPSGIQTVTGTITATNTTPGNFQTLGYGAVTTSAPTYTTATNNALSLTTAGALRVDNSGVTQPVSGTVATTQSGVWNTGRTWSLASATDSITVVPSGTQTVSGTITANVGTTNGLALDSSVQNLITAVKATIGIAGTVWFDPTTQPVTYYVRRETVNEGTGAYTVTWENVSGTTATPTVSNLVAVSNSTNIENQNVTHTATAGGTGYANGDILIHCFGVDTALSTPALAYSFWFNAGPSATGVMTAAPIGGSYVQASQAITAATLPLPSNAAQETGGNLASINTKTPALGQALAASSVPVVLTAAQLTTLTPLSTVGLSAGAANIGTVGQAGTWTVTATNSTPGNFQVMNYGAVTTAAPTYTTATNNAFSLTTAGALRVDNSGVTQPVSGTFWQATQPVSLTSLPALAAGNAAIGSVTVTSLPSLPAGANAIGTVGVSSLPSLPTGANAIGSVTVTSIPALPTGGNVIGSVSQNGAWTVTATNATAGNFNTLSSGTATTAAPSYSTGTNNPLSLTLAGALRVDASATTQPVSLATLPALATGANTIGNIGTVTAVTAITNALPAGANNIGSVNVASLPALPTGSNAIGTVSVTALPSLPTGANTIGSVNQGGAWSVTATQATAANLNTLTSGSVTTAAPVYTNGTTGAVSLTTAGALRVDASATTQPVSLAALPALPAGANAIGSVIVSTLPSLPAGANAIGSVTVTTLPALPAGANSIGAVTQGGSWTVTASNTTPANLQVMNYGAVTTASPTYTTGTNNALSLTVAGALRTDSSAVTQPVSGTFWQATQPVSLASLPALPAGANTIGSIANTSFAATQATASALNATVVGTGTFAVQNTAALPAGANVIGGVTQSGTWTVTAVNPTAANFQSLSYGATTATSPTYSPGNNNALSLTTAGHLRVDASDTTQPVSGTVTVSSLPALATGTNSIGNINTVSTVTAVTAITNALPTGANSIGGVTQSGSWTVAQGLAGSLANSWPVKLSDGTNTASITALTNSHALNVSIVDGSGNQITSFGGTSNPAASTTGVAAPAAASYTGWASGGNLVGTTLTTALPVQPGTGATFPVSIASMPSTPVTGTFWQATQPVSGTFWQATQPVSVAALPALSAGSAAIGTVGVTSLPTLPAGTNNIGSVNIGTMPALPAGANAIGSVVVSSIPSLPAGVNTIGAISNTSFGVTGTFWQAVQPVSNATPANFQTLASGSVTTAAPTYTTGTNNALSLTIAGALRVDNSAVTQPVSIASMPSTPVTGTFWQTTQPISGTISATQSGTWNIGSITTLPALATGANVIGSIANTTFGVTQATAANLNATVVGTGTFAVQNTSPIPAGSNAIGSVTVTSIAGSGTTGAAVPAAADYTAWNSGGNLVGVSLANALPIQPGTGAVFNVSGTVAATQSGTWNIGSITSLPSLPTGANVIGSIANTTFGVTGTFWQATQPVSSASAANLPTLGYGAVTTAAPTYTTATNNVLSLTTAGALRVDNSAVTQPVSIASMPTTPVTGTIAATQSGTWNIGSITTLPSLPAGANAIGSITNTSFIATQATAANLNATVVNTGTFAVQNTASIPAGSNAIGTVGITSSVGSGSTGSAVPGSADYIGWASGGNLTGVSLTSALPIQPGTGASFPVTGTFWQATQPVSLAALPSLPAGANAIGSITNTSFIATQATAANLNATIVGTGTLAVQNTAAIPAGANTIGSVNQAGTWTVTASNTTAGNLLTLGYGAVTTAAPTYTTATNNALSLTTAGALRVDASATTQPVSISGSVPVTGTFWQATQPVSLASLPALPTGANTIGSIANTSFAVTQATAANLNATVVGTGTFAVQNTAAIPTGANTIGGVTQSGTWNIGSITTLPALPTGSNNIGSVTANIGTTNGLALDSSVQSLISALKATINISGTVWYDPTTNPVTYYVRTESVNEGTGAITVMWQTPSGTTATPTVANLIAVSNSETISSQSVTYTATGAGTGYASGDILVHCFGIDTALATPALAYSFWFNAGPSANAVLAGTPTGGTYVSVTQAVSIASMPTTPVTGTFWQATQPVSVATLPALSTGANTIGSVTQSGTWNIGSITSLPSLAAGSNAIGSITNTSFGVTQATASALNATVVGTGTFAVQNTASIPAGANAIGTVGVSSSVGSGTTGAAVPTSADYIGWSSGGNLTGVSLAAALPVQPGTGATFPVSIASMPSTPVTGTFWQATQPVSSASAAAMPTLSSGTATTSAPTYTTATNNPLSLTLAGALRVDASSTTQPVSLTALPALAAGGNVIGSISNTSFIATQSTAANLNATVVGTGTFSVQNTASIPAGANVIGGVTQSGTWNIGSITTLPALAAGSNAIGSITNTSFIATQATAANLNATVVGTGTFAVQNTAALPTGANTIGSVNQAGTWTVTATNSTPGNFQVMNYGAVIDKAPTYPTGTNNALSLTTAGALRVDASATTQPVSISGSVPVTGTFWQATQPVSLSALPALAAGANTIGAVTQSGTWNIGSITTLPSLPTGANVIGSIANTTFAVTQTTAANLNATVVGTGTFAVQNTAALPAGSNAIGTVGVTSSIGSGTTGAAIPTSADYVGWNSGGNLVGVGLTTAFPVQPGTGATFPVSIASMPSTPVTGTFWQATQPVSIASMPSTPVTGTFWQATQPVSNSTPANLQVMGYGAVTTAAPVYTNSTNNALSLTLAGALRVDGSAVTQPVSIASMPSTPVTGTFWQATQPVSGTVAATQSGTWNIGSITSLPSLAAGGNVIGSIANTTFAATQSGSWNVAPTVGGTAVSSGNPLPVSIIGGSSSNPAASATGSAVPASAGYTGWNSGGNLVGTSLTTALPIQAGTGATFPVTGTFWQATQPVSLAALPSLPTGSNTIGAISNTTFGVTGTFWQATQPVSIASMPTTPVTGTFWQATQPVSSASAASMPTLSYGAVTTAAPAYTNATNNVLSLTTAGALRVDNSAVTQPVSIASMPSTPVTGTFWQSTQPVSLAALPALPTGANTIGSIANTSFIATQATAANLNATVVGTGTFAVQNTAALPAGANVIGGVTQSGTWNIGSITTLPSLPAGANSIGSVTANIGTTNGLALDSSVQALITALKATINISGTVWYDPTTNPVTYYVRTESVNEGTGAISVTWQTPSGTTATPTVTNLVAVSNSENISSQSVTYTATAGGTGYASGDVLVHCFGIDTAITTPVLAYSFWFNAGPSANAVLASAPTGGTYVSVTQAVSIASMPTTPVTGTFWQATQPVSLTALPSLPTGANAIGSITNTSFAATQATAANLNATVVGTGTFAVQNTAAIPTGTNSIGQVTANAGTNLNTSALALETGGNLAAINTKIPALGQALAAASVPVVLTAAQLTTLTPLSTVSLSAGAAVIGAVTQSGSWTTTVTQATPGNLQTLSSGSATTAAPTYTTGTNNPLSLTLAGALRVDASATTQPVSGSVSITTVPGTSATGAAIPTSADYIGWNSGGNLVGASLASALPIQPGTGASFPVTGTFWQATQPVSIASSVPVTGTFWQATQPVSSASAAAMPTLSSGTATTAAPAYTNATNNPLSLTTVGALRVDGSGVTQPVSVSGSVPVTGTFWQATQPVSGTIAATQSGTWNIGSITTLPALAAGSNAIGSITNTSFIATQATAANLNATIVGTGTLAVQNTAAIPTGANTIGAVNQAGTWTVTATNSTPANLQVMNYAAVTTAAPTYTTGTNNALSLTLAGALRVDGSAVTQPVSGTFWQATQPVSLTALPALAAGANTIGSIANTTFGATQSGTWNIGSITTLPSLPAGSNAIGSITNTSFAATQATASALNATVVGTGTFAVQNTAATPAGTNMIGSVKLTDGTNTVSVGNLTNSKPLSVMIVDGTGTQITSFGGGGGGSNAAASATGAAVPASASYTGFNSGGNLVGVSTATPMPVNVVSSVSAMASVGTTGSAVPASADLGGWNNSGTLVSTSISNPIPTAPAAAYLITSIGNSSTAQLASGGQFVGAIENVTNQPNLKLNITSDMNLLVTINQYLNSNPISLVDSTTLYVWSYNSLNTVYDIPGNYVNIVITNTDASTTTNFAVDTKYGTMPSVTQYGNRPIAINEVGGVPVYGGVIPVTLGGTTVDDLGQLSTSERVNDVELTFPGSGSISTLMNVSTTGSAKAVWQNGQAVFSGGATNPSNVICKSYATTNIRPGSEVYAIISAYWSVTSGTSFQRIGNTDFTDGYYIGFENGIFCTSTVSGGVHTHVQQPYFTTDVLTGAAGSAFTRNGVVEAVNFATQNLFRIRSGWIGSSSVLFEILSPDGKWILFNILRNANLSATPVTQNPNLPISVWVSDAGTSTVMGTNGAAAGSSSQFNTIASPVTGTSLGITTQSVGYGKTAAGAYIPTLVDGNGATVMSGQSQFTESTLSAATAKESPIFTAITGDSNGDLAGVRVLEDPLDSISGLASAVSVINQPTADVNGNIILSDAPKAVKIYGLVGNRLIIDTTGYSTMSISMLQMAGGLTGTNDLSGTWQAVTAFSSTGAAVTTLSVNTNYIVPCITRYLAITVTTAGAATYYLRSQPIPAGYLSVQSTNITQIAGTSQIAGGLSIAGSASSNGQTLGTQVTTATPAINIVKASAGRIYMLSVGNPNTSAVYLKVWNATTATLGTTAATLNYYCPASQTVHIPINDSGIYCSAGIVLAVTGGQSLTDNTAITTGTALNYSFI